MDEKTMKKKIINVFCYLFILTQVIACQPSEQELEACNQDINHKLKLTKPYSNWVQVLCTKEGQIIKPAKGYQWLSKGNDDIYLNKTGEAQSFSKRVVI
ncbi:MAG: hypothetical protein R3E95_23420 [Thiolinea sp.]